MKAVIMISVSKKIDALFLVVDNKRGVGDTALVTIFCGRTWTIALDNEKLLEELADLTTVLRALLML